LSCLPIPPQLSKDPTGAGGQLRRRLYGYLAGKNKTDFATLKKASRIRHRRRVFHNLRFLLKGLTKTNQRDIDGRLNTLRKLVSILATEFFSHKGHRDNIIADL